MEKVVLIEQEFLQLEKVEINFSPILFIARSMETNEGSGGGGGDWNNIKPRIKRSRKNIGSVKF